MNYRTLGYRFLYILFKFLYKLYKLILKVIAFSKRRVNLSFWQVILIAALGAAIFYGSSLLFSHDTTNEKTISNFEIVISKIEVQKDVYEGSDTGTLNKGPSHFPGTALPNEKTGNVVIFGHSAVTKEHDDPFGRLDELKEGDEVTLIYEKDEYKYRVREKKIVESADVSVIDSSEESILTLITCIKPDYPKDKRLIVIAERL